MKIAFLHYHLNTGGVTTVIRQQVDALKDICDIMVFTGESPSRPLPVKTVTLSGVGYDRSLTPEDTPERTAKFIITEIQNKYGGLCDVLHVHNPLLAKNKHFLKILNLLQQAGIRLFMHIHDFAEDGRPQAYYAKDPYPTNCHYGVINTRDYEALKSAGLIEKGLHRIDNIVVPPSKHENITKTKNYVLYPVMARRRKNIGEAILLSCFFTGNDALMITQPPTSIDDVESYNGWKAFVLKNQLKIKFEAGLETDYEELVDHAKYMMTTSISEGFGFSFLEPWLSNKGLWGRKLPELSHDFEINQLNLDHLYDEIRIPMNWVRISEFKQKWLNAYQKAYSLFGEPISKAQSNLKYNEMTENGKIDFGLLDETSQKFVINKALSNVQNKSKLMNLNPHLFENETTVLDQHLISHNKRAVLTNYSHEKYAGRLMDIYPKVIQESVHHEIDKSRLFLHFIEKVRFSLLKWSPYEV